MAQWTMKQLMKTSENLGKPMTPKKTHDTHKTHETFENLHT